MRFNRLISAEALAEMSGDDVEHVAEVIRASQMPFLATEKQIYVHGNDLNQWRTIINAARRAA